MTAIKYQTCPYWTCMVAKRGELWLQTRIAVCLDALFVRTYIDAWLEKYGLYTWVVHTERLFCYKLETFLLCFRVAWEIRLESYGLRHTSSPALTFPPFCIEEAGSTSLWQPYLITTYRREMYGSYLLCSWLPCMLSYLGRSCMLKECWIVSVRAIH